MVHTAINWHGRSDQTKILNAYGRPMVVKHLESESDLQECPSMGSTISQQVLQFLADRTVGNGH